MDLRQEIHTAVINRLKRMIEPAAIKDDRWRDIIAPILMASLVDRRGLFRFKAVNLSHWVEDTENAKEVWAAVASEAEMSCAFLNDYGDHCKGLSKPVGTDVYQAWDRAVVTIIRRIIRYGDPLKDELSGVTAGWLDGFSLDELMPLEWQKEKWPLFAWSGELDL